MIQRLSQVCTLDSFEANRHDVLHSSLPRHDVSATTKCTMSPIVFITDPSLLRKDSRSRNLLQSTANSHVAKYNHRKRRHTNLQRRQNDHELGRLCLCKYNQPCHIHLESSRVEVPPSLGSSHSEYLSQTYGGRDENLMNTLFSYCEFGTGLQTTSGIERLTALQL